MPLSRDVPPRNSITAGLTSEDWTYGGLRAGTNVARPSRAKGKRIRCRGSAEALDESSAPSALDSTVAVAVVVDASVQVVPSVADSSRLKGS